MDKYRSRPSAAFGPDRRLTFAFAAGALIAIVLAAVSDAAGRLMFAAAAAVLAAYAISDVVWSPRLVADADGLTLRTPFTSARLTWPEVDRVVADSRLRHGLRSVTLEVDAGDTLVVFSRRTLGQDPELVADVVRGYRPSEGHRG